MACSRLRRDSAARSLALCRVFAGQRDTHLTACGFKPFIDMHELADCLGIPVSLPTASCPTSTPQPGPFSAGLTTDSASVKIVSKVTNLVTRKNILTRSISLGMAGILEELELEQPTLVTSAHLNQLVEQHGLRTPAKIVAARLRERGWLLPTGRRGVWEFAPAALAGPFSRNDPTADLRAFLLQRPQAQCGLTFQAAAWAHGFADRAPARLEVATASAALSKQLPTSLAGSVFDPRLPMSNIRGVPVLAPESVLVHMAARPAAVRSWASSLEWLPELAEALSAELVVTEISQRPSAVRVRTGYLLQGLRLDIAHAVQDLISPERLRTNKTWFGPRGKLKRHDSTWQIADTILPFNPRELRSQS